MEFLILALVPLFFLIFPNGLSAQEQVDIDLEIKRARGRRKYQSRKERGY